MSWISGAFVLAAGLAMGGLGLRIYLGRLLPRGLVVFFNAVPLYYRGNVYALRT